MNAAGPAKASPGARAVRGVRGLGVFLWDFVVGDDWVGAVGVGVLFGLAAVLVHLAHMRAWWVLPPGVALVLTVTLRRATRAARPARAAAPPAGHR